jgi:hypothetical protein
VKERGDQSGRAVLSASPPDERQGYGNIVDARLSGGKLDDLRGPAGDEFRKSWPAEAYMGVKADRCDIEGYQTYLPDETRLENGARVRTTIVVQGYRVSCPVSVTLVGAADGKVLAEIRVTRPATSSAPGTPGGARLRGRGEGREKLIATLSRFSSSAETEAGGTRAGAPGRVVVREAGKRHDGEVARSGNERRRLAEGHRGGSRLSGSRPLPSRSSRRRCRRRARKPRKGQAFFRLHGS